MTFSKEVLQARMDELEGLLMKAETLSDENVLSSLKREQEALKTLIELQEPAYENLYNDMPYADVYTIAENLSVLEAEDKETTKVALNDASELTARQNSCMDAIEILSMSQEEVDKEKNLLIAEHPIRYAIQSLKDTIAEISHAKENLYNCGVEYKNYRMQAYDAAYAMGNSAYQGLIAPIRIATSDTIESIATKASEQWKTVCNKFHGVKEKVCEKVDEFIFKTDVFLERFCGGILSANNSKINELIKNEHLRKFLIGKNASPEYVTAVKAEAWKKFNGKSPIDRGIEKAEQAKEATLDILQKLQTKAADLRVNVHNAVIDFRADCLIKSAEFAYQISTNVELKSIRYMKASKKLGEAEAQIKSEIDKLLGTSTYEAKEYIPNPEIQAQINALREFSPKDTVTTLLIESKERLLADEKKAWDKQEKRIALADERLKNALVSKEERNLAQIERLHNKSEKRFNVLYQVYNKLEMFTVRQMNKAVSLNETKMKVINTENNASLDKGQNKTTMESIDRD